MAVLDDGGEGFRRRHTLEKAVGRLDLGSGHVLHGTRKRERHAVGYGDEVVDICIHGEGNFEI